MTLVGDSTVADAVEPESPDRSLRWADRAVIGSCRLYQSARSGRPTGCRFVPTCSEFAVEAVRRYGAPRGVLLSAGRLLRCGPWGGHGFDPVPERSSPCSPR